MVLMALAFAFSAQLAQAASAPLDRTIWEGVYTTSQAERGAQVFERECRTCHKESLPDRVLPAARGGRFMEAWSEDTLESLFTLIKMSMPRGAPASLSDSAYTDIVAYILHLNELPAGSDQLETNALTGIRVSARNGPGPVPDFALVRVIGCLTRAPDKSWMLTNATEPVRTRDPEAAKDSELDRSGLVSSSGAVFRLLQVYLPPGSDGGRKVEAKGFLIRQPDNRISVTSLRTIAPTCD